MITGAGLRGQAPVTGSWRWTIPSIKSVSKMTASQSGAAASQTDATSEGVALGTALLAEGACFARGALVYRVREEPPLSLEFGAKPQQVQGDGLLMARAVRVLLASACAIALLSGAQACSTDQTRRRRIYRV